MAASPSPSRARDGSPEPDLTLSPRSRMEARLAAMETSSEEESDSGDQSSKSPAPAPRRSKPSSAEPTTQPTFSSGANSDDSEEEIRPRGRLAARMQAEKPTENEQKDSEEDSLPTAPRRLKKKQARASATPEHQNRQASSSPGLFVSPAPELGQPEQTANASESEGEFPTLKNPRFQALVERKRKERLAREAEEERKLQEKRERQAELDAQILQDGDGDSDGITDDEGGLKLTQGARPPRKAGKKAMEDMNRETQRMARNMQLAHEAKTRKKISKASLFERFNFKTSKSTEATTETEPKTNSSSRPTTPVSANNTDAEMKDNETPPSSPPVEKTSDKAGLSVAAAAAAAQEDEESFPTLNELLNRPPPSKTDKGKGKETETVVPSPKKQALEETTKPKRQFRVKFPQTSANLVKFDDPDDELQVTMTRKDKLNAVFDRVPKQKAKETSSLHALKMLAQVKSPGKEPRRKADKSYMTPGELQMMLHQRAREQAKVERERRMEELKAKGVIIQTEEEREKEMQDVEDIVTRARKEAEEIMEKEREAAKEDKRQKIASGELDPLAWDDSEDEDYEGSDEGQGHDEEVAEELEFSGSDDENADDEKDTTTGLFDEDASEDEAEAKDESEDVNMKDDDDESENELALPRANIRRSKKHAQIISDDEDDDVKDVVEATPKPKTTKPTHVSPAAAGTDSPAAPTSVLRSAKKNFIPGLPVAGPAGLGLTQIFAGTMDDSQVGPASGTMPSPMPSVGFPALNMTQDDTQSADDFVCDSQAEASQGGAQSQNAKETQGFSLHYTQTQMHGLDSLMREEDNIESTQFSMEPSQDGGLANYTPLRERFIEAPTPGVAQTPGPGNDGDEDSSRDSPLVRRGRLRRKMESVPQSTVETVAFEPSPQKTNLPATAFGITTAARKEKKLKDRAEYNKKKSKAKDMFQEQAEESEDEYAGLGGADGEDSSDDDAASVKEMIDDEGGKHDDEGKIAALHANRERERDEQMVNKLFHDVTTGMLRRKRGNDYDLSDSDDGGEARRRLKRRQFAKMQKALFTDERVKKIAEKPGNQAFLRTLEDRGSDEEMDFLDVGPEAMDTDDTQSPSQSQQTQDQTVPDSQPQHANSGEGRVPAKQRRTQNGKKPSNLGDIRESVSSLLEEPNAQVIPATQLGSDDEDAAGGEDGDDAPSSSNKENAVPQWTTTNPRRTGNAKAAVIDRMSLKRDSSSNLSTSSRLAFAMPSTSGSGSFKVPALLRRATTNSLTSSGAGGGSATTMRPSAGASNGGGFGEEGKIKRTAGKKSGVSALARETERRAVVQQSEKRREAKKWKGAEKRGKAVGGLFAAGQFE